MFEGFERLHRNKRLAYLDGLLCGILITLTVVDVMRNYREQTELIKLREEFRTEDKTLSPK